MNKSLATYSYNNANKITIFLLVLAIVDSILTDIGIRNHHISEANPLMRFFYEWNIPSFYTIKITLPLLLIYIMTKLPPKRYIHLLIYLTLFLYTLTLFQHIRWILQVCYRCLAPVTNL